MKNPNAHGATRKRLDRSAKSAHFAGFSSKSVNQRPTLLATGMSGQLSDVIRYSPKLEGLGFEVKEPERAPMPIGDHGTTGYKVADWAWRNINSRDYTLFSTHPKAGGELNKSVKKQIRLVGWLNPKCNMFVLDALEAAGHPPPLNDNGVIPGARDCGNSKHEIPGYYIVRPDEPLKAGDIVAGGGHVGIYYPTKDGHRTISASTVADRVVLNDWGFRKKNSDPVIIRRNVADYDLPW